MLRIRKWLSDWLFDPEAEQIQDPWDAIRKLESSTAQLRVIVGAISEQVERLEVALTGQEADPTEWDAMTNPTPTPWPEPKRVTTASDPVELQRQKPTGVR